MYCHTLYDLKWEGFGGREERREGRDFVFCLSVCSLQWRWVSIAPSPCLLEGQSVSNLICKLTGQDESSALWDRAAVIDSAVVMSLLNTGRCLTR